jgi:hypothetical protein
MRYALLIYERPGAYDGLTDDDRRAITGEYVALRDDPRVVDGERLAPAATASTVRMQDGRTLVSDGPFADTKEVFGGYYVVDADEVEAAQAIAARIPATRMGGSVEVRELVEPAR